MYHPLLPLYECMSGSAASRINPPLSTGQHSPGRAAESLAEPRLPRVGLHEPHADRGILQLRDGGTAVLVLYVVLLEEREGKEGRKEKSWVTSHLSSPRTSCLLALSFLQTMCPAPVVFHSKDGPTSNKIRSGFGGGLAGRLSHFVNVFCVCTALSSVDRRHDGSLWSPKPSARNLQPYPFPELTLN